MAELRLRPPVVFGAPDQRPSYNEDYISHELVTLLEDFVRPRVGEAAAAHCRAAFDSGLVARCLALASRIPPNAEEDLELWHDVHGLLEALWRASQAAEDRAELLHLTRVHNLLPTTARGLVDWSVPASVTVKHVLLGAETTQIAQWATDEEGFPLLWALEHDALARNAERAALDACSSPPLLALMRRAGRSAERVLFASFSRRLSPLFQVWPRRARRSHGIPRHGGDALSAGRQRPGALRDAPHWRDAPGVARRIARVRRPRRAQSARL